VRERRLCTLGEAVRKMAALPAEVFGLDDLGAVAPGKRANLVVFDPERVADRSTFAEPRQTPAGIALVLCGGRPILWEGTPTGERPGVVHVPR
jgi:N-acyl-D-amino-acid deacylase